MTSDDPALAPIGAAFRRALAAKAVLRKLMGDSAPPPDLIDPEQRRILAAGTPIQSMRPRTANRARPKRARDAARGGYGSVAFFGLTAAGNSLIAIGHNGLYRLDSAGGATRMELPRFTRVEGLLVSFALPEIVLVVTGINGRASLSGAVPIMALGQDR